MLILVAVTINTAVQSGLFDHAKNATQGWADKQREESNIGNDNYIKDTVNQYVSGSTTPTKPDRTGLSVGDYVAYTPTTVTDYKYTGLGTSSTAADNPSGIAAGTGSNPVDGIPQDTSLAWRILSINDDGSVDIVSAKPTSQKVYFKNSIGFNNGVYLLNDLCASLYSNSTLGVTARSMNLIDIESKFNAAGIAARDAYTAEVQYGDTKTYTDPKANVPDIYKHVGKTLAEETKPYYTAPTTLTHTAESSLDVQQTYYQFDNLSANYFDDATFHELVFCTGIYYWLASRYADCDTDCAFFGLRYVNGAYSQCDGLFDSYPSYYISSDFVRPVVSLGSDIQISATGGTADNPRTLSK